MALFKCKMCGGDLEISEGVSITECEYCGTRQTVPKIIDENLQNLFNRANTLRIKSEFDKAEKLYEKIIQADSTQADAYWGLILCKYGIEYVDDPVTYKKIPTCHRASFDSIIADDDYKFALQYADMAQRAVYEEQAKEIDRIQKEILALAQKEETYDVFICYKETDASGHRTPDSVIANDIYYQLKQEGLKVFYAAITLEGKLGSAYEPIIFAALHSAKVMLVIGTKTEYFNAVWVKNEWSRFLKIIKKDRSKLLIPCYRDMDAYELPDDFAHLQSQDMSKIGFINDVVRGIKKVIKKDEPKTKVAKETVVMSANANVTPILKRAFIFLEDGDWEGADEYFEKALDSDPENADAYLGKLMIELNVNKREQLKDCEEPFNENSNYQKVLRFGDERLKNEVLGYIECINGRIKNEELKAEYDSIVRAIELADDEEQYRSIAERFSKMGEYRDASARSIEYFEKAEKCRIEEEIAHKDRIYEEACSLKDKKTIESYKMIVLFRQAENYMLQLQEAVSLFEQIPEWKDSQVLASECVELLGQLEVEHKQRCHEEEQRLEQERIQKEKFFKKVKIFAWVGLCVFLLLFTYSMVNRYYIVPLKQYNTALGMMSRGDYVEARDTFNKIASFKDSKKRAEFCYQKLKEQAQEYIDSGNYIQFLAFSKKNSIYDVFIPKWRYDDFYNAVISYFGSDIESYYGVYVVKREFEPLIPYMKLISTHENAKDVIALYEVVKQFESGKAHELFKNNMKTICNTFDTPLCKIALLSGDILPFFLTGRWSDADGNYLKFEKAKSSEGDISSCTYGVPHPDIEHKYWDLQGLEFIFVDEDSKFVANVYRFEFVDANTLKVYAYEDGQTYILTRK